MKKFGLNTTAILATSIAIGAIFGAENSADAAIKLVVNVDTGNLQLVGDIGDTLASYVIYSTSHAYAFDTTSWNTERFGATSIADGYGTWHSMGTKSISGSTTTYQIGEMCAVWAGFQTDGQPNASTSKIFTFDATHTAIDIGNEFLTTSLQDLVFGYGTTPGFYNGSDVPPAGTDGWIFDGLEHTYTVNKTGSYYYNQTYTSTGVTGDVVYVNSAGDVLSVTTGPVPEPATVGILGLAGVGVLLKRRRKSA